MTQPHESATPARPSREALEVVLPAAVEPSGLYLRERTLPAPEPGRCLVAVEASGVSFAEQQMRRGRYFDQPPYPFVPGYDLVGRVVEVGPGVDRSMLGGRYAALVKTGGWATRVAVPAADLVPVPEGVDAAEAETFVVNGITAWQMLHRRARVGAGATVLVHGANGGVGSTLVQLARLAGIRVLGTASPRHHEALRALGAVPLDYRDPALAQRVRALHPGGLDAVFDHVGGEGIKNSFRLLAPGGTLVSYGTADTRDATGSSKAPVLKLFARLLLWNLLPNGRRAGFYNIWAGRRNATAFRSGLHADLGAVLELLRRGELTAQIAGRFPMDRAAEAMELAESGTVAGKVVLTGPEPVLPADHPGSGGA